MNKQREKEKLISFFHDYDFTFVYLLFSLHIYFDVFEAIKETNIEQIYRIVYDLPCNEFVTSDISYYTNANGQM